MRNILHLIRRLILTTVILAKSATLVVAQEVSIPDPGLNAAIRDALQKPSGPITEQDLLNLDVLHAGRRDIQSIEGLQAARNLVTLELQVNQLTNFVLPATLTNLVF